MSLKHRIAKLEQTIRRAYALIEYVGDEPDVELVEGVVYIFMMSPLTDEGV